MKFSFDLRPMRRALRALRPFATRRVGEPSALLLHASSDGLHLALESDAVSAHVVLEGVVETPGDHTVDFEELQADLAAIWKNLRDGGGLTRKRRQLQAYRPKPEGALRLTSLEDHATFRDVSARVSPAPSWERIQRRTSTPCEGTCERPAVAPHLVAAAKSAATALAAPLRFEVAASEGYIIRVERPGQPSLIAWVQGAKPEEPKPAPKAKAKAASKKATSKAKAAPKAKAMPRQAASKQASKHTPPPLRGLHWSGASLEPPQPAHTRPPLFTAAQSGLGQPPELRQVAPRVDDDRITPRRKRGTQWVWSPKKAGIYLAFWPWKPTQGEQATVLRLERGKLTLVEHMTNQDPNHTLLITALDRARSLRASS